jgi:branched-chain amino acid transport system ATP-binding protein
VAALLEVSDLHARYGETDVLHGISLSLEPGAFVAILGANGAGKTTTFRAITGAIKTSGSVRFDGASLKGNSPEAAARLGIAHVPEGRGTLSALTVRENLMLGAYTKKDPKRIRASYERVVSYFPRLGERTNQAAGTLSGGEQQMLAIGRALMMEPRLMLLDEPSLGIAPLIVREIFALLERINKTDGVTILVSEQNAKLALAAASHAYVLETGNIAVSGASADLINDDAVRKSYLGY